MKIIISVAAALFVFTACINEAPLKSVRQTASPGKISVPATAFAPRNYTCYRTSAEISVDGNITEDEWSQAPWSELFTDIEGDLKPAPLYDTKMKMLWDDTNLYIAAELAEPHIRASLRQRDTIIFHDNDFEIFIDPDGDTHGYYEFEMNAYNTVWDLLLSAPYRDFGQVIDAWDIRGLRSAVKVYGTINNPSDLDEKWTIELAFPFDVLKEWGTMPVEGAVWRMNFSRVNWKTRIENGKYVRERDPETGKLLSEFNWLWTPQGLINVHYPEMWGFVRFAGSAGNFPQKEFSIDSVETTKWELRRLYYAQRAYAEDKKSYADNAARLEEYGYKPIGAVPEILITMAGYEASLPDPLSGGFIYIDYRGRTWSSTPE